MKIHAMEAAVISRMLADPQLPRSFQSVEPLMLSVAERSISEIGFLTSFARTSHGKLFEAEISTRWGKVIGCLNSKTDVDFVVYVDDGYLTGVEGCTFGGEPWPSKVETFELKDLPDE